MKEENGMTMVVITHNIALAVQLCDRIAVMYQGDIVEVQETKTLDVYKRQVGKTYLL